MLKGTSSIKDLPLAKYRVFAMKPSAGYPNTEYSSFYGGSPAPEVTITVATPSATVPIRFGPRAATLTGVVEDAVTGAPVNAGFKLIRAASPGDWLSTSQPSNYRVLVPAARAILMRVSAPGYKTWAPRNPVRLWSGEERRLDISLQPFVNPKQRPSKFLVPEGYVGWVQLECNLKAAPPTPIVRGVRIFRVPANGRLLTSSGIPQQDGEKSYFYYRATGIVKNLQANYRTGHGMVWGASYGFVHGSMSDFHFFVGTEEQYTKRGYHGLENPTQ